MLLHSILASLNLSRPNDSYWIMLDVIADIPDRCGFTFVLREVRDGGGDNSSIGCGPDITTLGRYMTRAAAMRDFNTRAALLRAENPDMTGEGRINNG